MKFINIDELKSLISEFNLDIQLDNDFSIFEDLEMYSLSEIRALISSKYDAEFMLSRVGIDRNSFLVMLASDILIYNFYSRFSPISIPQHRIDRYFKATKYLQDINKGVISPDDWVLKDQFVDNKSQFIYGSTADKFTYNF